MMENDYDVVVVGAGISGLTAANFIARKDRSLRVLVLEAKDRVGGRTQTVSLKSSTGQAKWDLGGQWVGRCQPHILGLLEELGLSYYPQYLKGRKAMQLGESRVRFYSSDIPSLSVFALLDLHRFITKLDQMRKLVPADNPWSCPHASAWDSMTCHTFIEQTMWTRGAKDALEAAVRCMVGTETNQMSLLFFLMYTSAADGLRNLIEGTEYTAQEFKIKGGAQQVSEILRDRVGAKNVHLSEPVMLIQQDENAVTVTAKAGQQYQCKRVIMAVPPPALGKMDFVPQLPSFKQDLIRHMPFGSMIKIIITYDKAFWRDAGMSGEAVSYGGPCKVPDCDVGPICITYDASSHNGSPALVAFIGAHQALQWSLQNEETRRSGVLTQLASYFGEEVYNFLDYAEKDWSREPYTEGGPVCCVTPGSMENYANGLRQPHGLVHFAGTETATKFCGYMNGAVQAGYRSAMEVLQEIRPQVLTAADAKLVTSSGATATYNFIPATSWLKRAMGLGVVVLLTMVIFKRDCIWYRSASH